MPSDPSAAPGEKNGRRFHAPKSRYQRKRDEGPGPRPSAFTRIGGKADAIKTILWNQRVAEALSPWGDDFSLAAADFGQRRGCAVDNRTYAGRAPAGTACARGHCHADSCSLE